MKVVYIIPGAGDSFYCGNCFRDNLQASALRKMGHDVIIMPLYLPLKNEAFKTNSPLFFPATTYFVAQKFFQKMTMPNWMKRLLGTDSMLSFASSMSGTTSAKGMEKMTMSMIEGDNPAFLKEVKQLTEWLKYEKPDVVHISTSLLIGIAKAIKTEINIPVVCSLLDEEVWIDSMKESYIDMAWKAIGQNLQYVDKLTTVSNYYKDYAQTKVPEIKHLEVIYPGIDLDVYKPGAQVENPTIGFFYRLNKKNGLDILAKAFVCLKKKNTIPNLKLKIGGGFTSQDKSFINKVKKILAAYIDDVEFVNSYSMSDHIEFYQSISVLSVPLTFNEGISVYTCEALACGIPSVEPKTGAFPEVIENGGVLYEPNNSDELCNALEYLLENKDRYDQAAKNARNRAIQLFDDKYMAQKLLTIYESIQ
ncbi:glycosyltransferase family 4 protein [Plebeiibacterium sediminum]|uniref:Glycosyltransferase family 4 protein n=1 Tax=Plebeiibacterium sediminum TaxID=2992112 RepID=A0AAE3M1S9_9BACT|nr:glycosyltransferase family 4 protein [Plebeiobacterium sediminum]MCW3785277.1 glycosyltransferase family 4 protein [Plebeiobacterium sediminum]